MPFRMVFANPFVLAAVTVVAIGVITYQILNNKKRIPVRGSRGGGSGGPYGPGSGKPPGPGSGKPSGPGSGKPSGPDYGSGRPSGPDYGSGRPDESTKTSEGWTVNTNDNNGKVKACDNLKSENQNENSFVIRRRNVPPTSASHSMSGSENLTVNIDCNNQPYSFTNSFDEKSDSSSDLRTENPDTSERINKTLNAKSEQTFVANINDDDDEDSDSSESNASLGSNENDNMSVFSNESNCTKASASTTEYKKRKNSSSVDSSEELYKRKVCNYLKNNINKDDSEDKTNDELLESSLSVPLDEPSTSSASMKPVMCKGCLEEFANAVAYPCQHCYLCLDCAFKVHRIYKKCSICQSVVKTFEQLKM